MKQQFIFANCTKTNILWGNTKEFFDGSLKLPSLIPQSATFMFGFSDVDRDIFLLSNHILLLFQCFIYICFQDFLETSRKYTL